MEEPEWRLLTTLPDVPSAQSLVELLSREGVAARVSSDVGVLGQAAPSSIYVIASQLHQARRLIAPDISEEELEKLSGTASPEGKDRRAGGR